MTDPTPEKFVKRILAAKTLRTVNKVFRKCPESTVDDLKWLQKVFELFKRLIIKTEKKVTDLSIRAFFKFFMFKNSAKFWEDSSVIDMVECLLEIFRYRTWLTRKLLLPVCRSLAQCNYRVDLRHEFVSLLMQPLWEIRYPSMKKLADYFPSVISSESKFGRHMAGILTYWCVDAFHEKSQAQNPRLTIALFLRAFHYNCQSKNEHLKPDLRKAFYGFTKLPESVLL